MENRIAELRASPAADAIRAGRLIVVLRRITPQERLLALIVELAAAGAEVFEVTFDAPSAAADLPACRERLEAEGHDTALIGAGTIRTRQQLDSAQEAGAAFVVSPVLDLGILDDGL